MLKRLRSKNPGLRIGTADDPEFKKYGTPVKAYDYSEIIKYIEERTPMPEKGATAYVPDLEETHRLSAFKRLQDGFFGAMPMQLGYCNGYNGMLDALEFHKGSELVVAATDCVLLLASLADLAGGKLASGKVAAFYVARGQAVELYGPTLHYAPCAAGAEGFKTAILLPKGTNLPLAAKDPAEPMLRMSNKWLLAHPDCAKLAASGAYLGITGENIRVNY